MVFFPEFIAPATGSLCFVVTLCHSCFARMLLGYLHGQVGLPAGGYPFGLFTDLGGFHQFEGQALSTAVLCGSVTGYPGQISDKGLSAKAVSLQSTVTIAQLVLVLLDT